MEFSDELMKRCAIGVMRSNRDHDNDEWAAVRAVLNESGHAELVAALKPFAGILAKDFTTIEIERLSDESSALVPVSVKLVRAARGALRKAGHP